MGKILELKRIVKFREHNFQPSQSHEKVRRDFSSQLACRCVRITLKLPATSLGKLYESSSVEIFRAN